MGVRSPDPTPAFVLANGAFKTNEGSARLLASIGGGDTIRSVCTAFYEHAFRDVQLSPFMFEDDGAAAHGKRLGDWIVQKMGGEGEPWAESGRLGMRQPSHAKAWHSPHRAPADAGSRFKLKDCRVWMRLMFLAAREHKLHASPEFWGWYVKFLRHFIGVYERTAPAYAEESAEWSASARRVGAYVDAGHVMPDL